MKPTRADWRDLAFFCYVVIIALLVGIGVGTVVGWALGR